MTLSIGQPAPDFEIPNQHLEKVSLSSFKGKKNVLLTFYPFSFTGTCTGELCEIRDDLSAFQNDDVQVIAISCDTPSHSACLPRKRDISFLFFQIFGLTAPLRNLTESLKNQKVAHFVEVS